MEMVKQGVSNMEMEALVFAALTNMAGIRSAKNMPGIRLF